MEGTERKQDKETKTFHTRGNKDQKKGASMNQSIKRRGKTNEQERNRGENKQYNGTGKIRGTVC